MKFTLQKTFNEICQDDEVLLLVDMPAVEAGTKGVVVEKNEECTHGVIYRWIIVQWKIKDRPVHALPLTDSFTEQDLNILNFKVYE